MNTRLIIVEGIPGSGKSTTAQFIHSRLEERGLRAHLRQEGSASHPAALDGLAFLERDQYQVFLANHSQYRERLRDSVIEIAGGFMFNYWGMKKAGGEDFPDDLFKALSAFDVYETLTAERTRQLSLERWQTFASEAVEGLEVYVFECCFLQDTLTVLLGQHNCDLEVVRAHILAVAEAVVDLDPILVYLDVENVRKVLEMAVEVRPQTWINSVTEYITGQGYGRAHGLVGFEGVVRFYELLHEQQTDLLPRLVWRTLKADVSSRDWEVVHAKIAEFLDEAT